MQRLKVRSKNGISAFEPSTFLLLLLADGWLGERCDRAKAFQVEQVVFFKWSRCVTDLLSSHVENDYVQRFGVRKSNLHLDVFCICSAMEDILLQYNKSVFWYQLIEMFSLVDVNVSPV